MILYNKYEKYLDKKTLNKYLFKIVLLKSELEQRVLKKENNIVRGRQM